MKKGIFLFFIYALIANAQTTDSLTFSEIMFVPSASNSEFVEIYNYANSTSYNLTGLKFKYHTSKVDSFLVVSDNSIIAPQSYAVILERDYDFTNGIYIIPDSVIILTTTDNAFGSSGMSNSSDRTLRLLSSNNDTLSVYTYTADNLSGYSDEKTIMISDNSSSNWSNSQNVNGSPGYRNSVSPYKYDVSALSIVLSPDYITNDDSLYVGFTFTNLGTESAPYVTLNTYFDSNLDSIGTENEKFFTRIFSDVNSRDTIEISLSTIPPDTGKFNLIAQLEFPDDENISNNTIITPVFVYPPKPRFSEIVINEIMYEPVSGEPEWIELYNNTDSVTFNLKNWRFADKSSTPVITDSDKYISPGRFALLTSGDGLHDFYDFTSQIIVMNLPTLNNSGDNLKLIDSLETVIDSVNYLSDWNGSPPHYSLERISSDNSNSDSLNWSGSINPSRATPGQINSVTVKDYDLVIKNIWRTPDTALVNETITISAQVNNIGKQGVNFSLDLNLLSQTDSLPVSLIESIPFSLANGDSAELSFTPLQVENTPRLFGITARFASDQDTTNNSKMILIFPSYPKRSVVINEIQFAPSNGEPEWFELQNNTSGNVNLSNWKMNDLLSIPHVITLFDSDLFLSENEKIIIAKDSAIFDYHNIIPGKIKIIQFPNLSNSCDGVVINDANGKTIDSVLYNSRWGGRSGKSLERILPFAVSTDSTNWGSSIDTELSTPGRKNSITPFDSNLAIANLSLAPDYVTMSDTLICKAKIENQGLTDAGLFYVNFYFDTNRDSIIEDSEQFASLNFSSLSVGDSIFAAARYFPSDTGNYNIFAKINYYHDQSSGDDIASSQICIYPNLPRFSEIVINEIAYHPPHGQPEWIELFNNTDSTTFNLFKWKIADRNSSITITRDTILLAPQSFAVLTPTDTINDFYNINSRIIIVHLPSLNNENDDIRLIDSIGTVIDSVYYQDSWNNSAANSTLEKISPLLFGNDSTSWEGCINPKLGTPGDINSVTEKEYDIKVEYMTTIPENPYFGENFNISVKVKNIGKHSATVNLLLYSDVNNDSLPDILLTNEQISLSSSDSISHIFNLSLKNLKERTFTVKAQYSSDMDTTNNSKQLHLFPSYRHGTIKINEVHYAPIDGEPEWVELENCSGDTVDLKGWEIGDILLHPTTAIISDSNIFLTPDEKLIIAKDSIILDFHKQIPSKLLIESFPNLNNSEDGIILKDRADNVIDSLLFHSDWGNISGASLERISLETATNDSTNWGSSKDTELSTPGRKNSLTIKQFDIKITKLEYSPTFPDSGNNIILRTTVLNIGNEKADSFTVRYYYFSLIDSSFHPFAETQNVSLQPGDSLTIERTCVHPIIDSMLFKSTAYFSIDEDTSDNSQTVLVKTGISEHALIINEVMNIPKSGEPEWCELYNNTNSIINLAKVFICDSSKLNSKSQLADSISFINPYSYLVVTPDSSFYEILTRQNINSVISNFGSLGNLHDCLFIYDYRGNLIDSVAWDNNWQFINGKSIEKIGFDDANISSNWFPSLDSNNATPGELNSVTNYNFTENPKLVINEIMYSPSSDNGEYIELYNYGNNNIEIGGWRILDLNAHNSILCPVKYRIKAHDYFLFALDSNVINYYNLDSAKVYISPEHKISLPNDEGMIIIKDFRHSTIDSVKYYSTWHNTNFIRVNNRSLEKINPVIDGNNPTNWSSCVNNIGGTPLQQNSIFLNNNISNNEISITPNPFSPDNDGYEDFTIINYKLVENISRIRVRVFDSIGRLVRTLTDNSPSGQKGEIVFDGKDESGNPLRMGIYVLLVEEIGNSDNSLKIFKKAVVIARKL